MHFIEEGSEQREAVKEKARKRAGLCLIPA
jgi:hypothetical protein